MAESFFKDLGMENTKIFSVEHIHAFTSNLSKSLGSGGFGDVYEGVLSNGVKVAVKVLRGEALSDGMKSQLKAEVGVLCRTHHRNLVKLYGFCFEHEMTALVYEFMENKSLDTILYGNQGIEWDTICNIAIGTANGLSYLHKDCQPSIIHYDIKPSNILLDSKFTAKVGDFGLAMHLNQDKSHITLLGRRGTCIYMAPEMNRHPLPITHKCDVYSYGITLFDLIGRRKHPVACDKNWFPARVWKQFMKKRHAVIMEECGILEKDREHARRILMIALQCVQFRPEHRPSMSCVLRLLESSEKVEMPLNPFVDLASSSGTKIEDLTPKVGSSLYHTFFMTTLPPNPFVDLASSSGTKIEDLPPKKELAIKQEKNNGAHRDMEIKLARDEDLVEQIGRHILTDLHDKVWSYRIKKSTPFYAFKEKVEKKFGIPVQFQRYWLWRRCSDKSYRPTRPLTPEEETQSVDQVREIYNKAELRLFLEVQRGPDLQPIKLPKISNRDILIFVKCDDLISKLSYVGRLFVDKKSKPSEVLTKLKAMAGFSSSKTTPLFMEISINSRLDYISVMMNMTFKDNKIRDGDILCIEKAPRIRKKKSYDFVLPREQLFRSPDVPYHYRDDHYSYLDIPYDGNLSGPFRYPDDHYHFPHAPYGYPDGPPYFIHNIPYGNPSGPYCYPDDQYLYPDAPYSYPDDLHYFMDGSMDSYNTSQDEGETSRRKGVR